MNWILNTSNRKVFDKNKFKVMKAYAETSFCKKQIINWYFDNSVSAKKCNKCSFCNSQIKSQNQSIFITTLNKLLLKQSKHIDVLLGQLYTNTNNHYSNKEIDNFLWQLIFNNIVEFDKKDYLLSLNNKISDIIFNDLAEIDYNYVISTKKKVVKKKVTKKKVVKKKVTKKKVVKKKVVKKKVIKKKVIKKTNIKDSKMKNTKNSSKPKKILSEKQKAALAAGRQKAAENRAKKGNKKVSKNSTTVKKAPFVSVIVEKKKEDTDVKDKKKKDSSRKNYLTPSSKGISRRPKK